MSTALALVLLAVLVHLAGALASYALRADDARASRVSAGSGLLASLIGLAGAIPVLLRASIVEASLGAPDSFLPLALRLSPLGALLMVATCLLSAATSLYGLGYVREYSAQGIGRLGLLTGCFLAAMLLCLIADDALTLMVSLEALSVASCLLIVFERDRNARGAGARYFAVSFAGSILIAISFLVLFRGSGSLRFASVRAGGLSEPLASAAFLLALLGFGAKAGVMPLHGWLPQEAGAAPAHISALISGAMVKIGVFGVAKVGVDLLHATTPWWGFAVLAMGAVSAVLGAMYALAERDVKRLLAYSTVENVGIIWIGIGIGMVGVATGRPQVGVLGLLAGLYHLLNHAVFKGLLVLGAGSVVSQVGTREMDRMGGIARRMPWTASTFLVGAAAISALPPLNGFVSEWFAYQALFQSALDRGPTVRLLAPLAMVSLAMTGALTLMAFAKSFGLSFLGTPRSARAGEADEVAPTMRWSLALLAGSCALLGLGAPLVAPVVRDAAASLAGPGVAVAGGVTVFAGDPAQGVISPVMMSVLLVSLLSVPITLASYYASERPPRRIAREIWATGYAPEAAMHVSAAGFAEPIRVMFRPAFALRRRVAMARVGAGLPASKAGVVASRTELATEGPAPETPGPAAEASSTGGSRSSTLVLAASIGLIALFAVSVRILSAAGGR